MAGEKTIHLKKSGRKKFWVEIVAHFVNTEVQAVTAVIGWKANRR